MQLWYHRVGKPPGHPCDLWWNPPQEGVPGPRLIPTFISITDGEQLDPKWSWCAVCTCQQSVTLETSHSYATSALKANLCCCNQFNLDCEYNACHYAHEMFLKTVIRSENVSNIHVLGHMFGSTHSVEIIQKSVSLMSKSNPHLVSYR